MDKKIEIVKTKFIGIYCSAWFDEKISLFCEKKGSTVSEDAPDYSLALVFKKYMTLQEILYTVEQQVLNKYSVELAKWRKSLHVKFLYNVVDCEGKTHEVWIEANYNGETEKWTFVDEGNDLDCLLVIREAQNKFPFVPCFCYRWIGSLFSKVGFFSKSNFRKQFIAVKNIDLLYK